MLCLFSGKAASAWQAIAPCPVLDRSSAGALSLLVLVLGVLGADIFLPRVSLLILLAGLIILFQGWTFFRAVLFPWAFLILMVPIPALIISRVTFPLQLLASKLATALLELVGVPVLRQGNVITLAPMQLDVAEACSGIRSLLTLVTLAIIYGYLMETRKWVRVVLACRRRSDRSGGQQLSRFWHRIAGAVRARGTSGGLLPCLLGIADLRGSTDHVVCRTPRHLAGLSSEASEEPSGSIAQHGPHGKTLHWRHRA